MRNRADYAGLIQEMCRQAKARRYQHSTSPRPSIDLDRTGFIEQSPKYQLAAIKLAILALDSQKWWQHVRQRLSRPIAVGCIAAFSQWRAAYLLSAFLICLIELDRLREQQPAGLDDEALLRPWWDRAEQDLVELRLFLKQLQDQRQRLATRGSAHAINPASIYFEALLQHLEELVTASFAGYAWWIRLEGRGNARLDDQLNVIHVRIFFVRQELMSIMQQLMLHRLSYPEQQPGYHLPDNDTSPPEDRLNTAL